MTKLETTNQTIHPVFKEAPLPTAVVATETINVVAEVVSAVVRGVTVVTEEAGDEVV